MARLKDGSIPTALPSPPARGILAGRGLRRGRRVGLPGEAHEDPRGDERAAHRRLGGQPLAQEERPRPRADDGLDQDQVRDGAGGHVPQRGGPEHGAEERAEHPEGRSLPQEIACYHRLLAGEFRDRTLPDSASARVCDAARRVLLTRLVAPFDADFGRLLDYHRETDAFATVAAMQHRVEIPFGVLRINGHQAFSIEEKPSESYLCNAGIYVLSPDALALVPADTRIATVYYKPKRNRTSLTPDYFVHECDDWLVFPHEICGLSEQEIRDHKPQARLILNRK